MSRMKSIGLSLLAVAALFAAASCAHGAVIFQDDFSAIGDGQPDPAWLALTGGPWVVRNGEYVGAGEWNVVKDLVVGDCIFSADMTVPGSGIILRAQNATPGKDPDQKVLVLFEPYGIDVYRDNGEHQAQGRWSDGLNHTGEWVNLQVTMVGKRISATAKLKDSPDVTAVIPRIPVDRIHPDGSIGLHRRSESRFDNIVVSSAKPGGTSSDNIIAYAYGDGKLSVGDSVKMRDYEFPIVSVVDGYPVYMIGDVAVYGVSPSVVPDATMQDGNASPTVKIVPKQSYEISSNYIGLNPSRLPNSAKSEELPFVSSHLIDGNYETSWQDRGARAPDLETPSWVRIDLPKPTVIDRINLVPPEYCPVFNLALPPSNFWAWPGALPEQYMIEVTTDGHRWEAVQDVKDQAVPNDQIPSFKMPEKPILQVRITGKKVRPVHTGFAFGLAEVELIDKTGRNVALVSNGGMAFVSSTNYGYANRRQTRSDLWPLMYDIGAKWLRTGYWSDTTSWYFVERKPGILRLDPVTKNALIEATDYGITVTQGLYSMPYFYSGRSQYTNGFASYHALYNWPTSPEQLDAWRNYVRYMVNELKGYVKYWEVWNEAFDVSGGLGGMAHIDPYLAMLKIASEEIRKADPRNKVIFTEVVPLAPAVLDIIDALLEKGAGRYGDAIAWHPYQGVRPEIVDPNFMKILSSKYPEIRYPDISTTEQMWDKMREIAKKHDFSGRYFANEYWWSAVPPSSELTKAKYAVRNAVLHSAHDITFFWCEIWHNYNPKANAGLLRVGPSMEPDTPQTPAPVYYALRTICTMMDGAKPDPGLKIKSSNTQDPLETHGFHLPDGSSLIALWRPIDADDACPAAKTDIVIAGVKAKKVLLQDVLNGTQQEGEFLQEGNGIRIMNLLVRDYPMFLRLSY